MQFSLATSPRTPPAREEGGAAGDVDGERQEGGGQAGGGAGEIMISLSQPQSRDRGEEQHAPPLARGQSKVPSDAETIRNLKVT